LEEEMAMKIWGLSTALLVLGGCGSRDPRTNFDTSSPLADAISHERWEEAGRLVDAGADPNTKVYGSPAIFWAVMQDDKTMADKLAAKGARLNPVMPGGRSLADTLAVSSDHDDPEGKRPAALAWLAKHRVYPRE
jgi:hypothetical protein